MPCLATEFVGSVCSRPRHLDGRKLRPPSKRAAHRRRQLLRYGRFFAVCLLAQRRLRRGVRALVLPRELRRSVPVSPTMVLTANVFKRTPKRAIQRTHCFVLNMLFLFESFKRHSRFRRFRHINRAWAGNAERSFFNCILLVLVERLPSPRTERFSKPTVFERKTTIPPFLRVHKRVSNVVVNRIRFSRQKKTRTCPLFD